MATYKPLTLEMLEEGRLKADLDAKFREAQATLCAYMKKHGDRATKAKATVTLKLVLIATDPEDMLVSVRADLNSTTPTRPPTASAAFIDTADDGTRVLFARASGSDSHPDPRQGKLLTESGEAIDANTGEVRKEPKK